jgi:uridine phosphorylase
MNPAIPDFPQALALFRAAYHELFTLVEAYPAAKGEQPGACGWWSPKQVLAHLSGWLVKADERYAELKAGDARDLYYGDFDTFNAGSVQARAGLGWRETVADLRMTFDHFAEDAANLTPAHKADKRYREWLVSLAEDCQAHVGQLRDFLARSDYPILEFDPVREAIIEPSRIIKPIDIPPHCVLCFFQDAIATACGAGKGRIVTHLSSEVGKNPVYEIALDGKRLAVAHPGVGAPLAAGFLEELIALGCRKFIACGGAGVLDSAITVGHVVVPTSAIRDEGASYHYLPPSRTVAAHPDGVRAVEAALKQHHVPYVTGKTWTTDAVYRETRAKMEARKSEGCITVEMEAAAFFAVAQFRGVPFAQLLYGGDDLSGDQWDHRDWLRQTSSREKLFWLAAEACLLL